MSAPPRVLHVNDVAGVASAAVAWAAAQRLPWRLWPLPPVRGRPLAIKVGRRARDLVRFYRHGRCAQVLHIHYGMFGYYAWFVRRPYVLHLHGTDVRVNLTSRVLGPLVRRAVRRAGAVVYSTPDLADEVRAMRPDATWLPAPLDPQVCATVPEPRAGAGDRRRVVFSARWDPIKGTEQLLSIARRLRVERPELDLVGVDWGVQAAAARQAGVRLVPKLPHDEFIELLAGADVVIGQQAGLPLVVVADLEAMVLGRPVIASYTASAAYGDEAPLWNTVEIDAVDAVGEILADPGRAAARAAEGRAWALRHHGADRFGASMLPVYQRLAGAS